MRLVKNNHQKKRNRAVAKRLWSPIERNRGRMSVGEVMELSPAASYADNLSEARAMDSARSTAAMRGLADPDTDASGASQSKAG